MPIKTNIEDFLDHLAYQKRYSVHTVKAYRTDLLAFADYLDVFYECTSLGEVTRRMISSFIADQAELGIAPRSIHRKLSAIQSFLNHGMKEAWVTKNPAKNIQRPKTSKHLPKVMRSEQIEALFAPEQFTEDFVGKRDHALLAVLYACGLRREELIELKKAEVDLHGGQLKVLGKRNKERLLPIGKSLIGLLQNYLEERQAIPGVQDTGQLFVTEKGQKMYPNLVYTIVKNYLSKVTTMEQRSPHILRHTFATHLLNEGANLQSIKELLGHSSLGTTQVYTHTSLEKLKDVYKHAHPRSKK
ncbi:MAG: tyrosine-type recombinase/integrase [Cryomorphaceae bacterium]